MYVARSSKFIKVRSLPGYREGIPTVFQVGNKKKKKKITRKKERNNIPERGLIVGASTKKIHPLDDQNSDVSRARTQ